MQAASRSPSLSKGDTRLWLPFSLGLGKFKTVAYWDDVGSGTAGFQTTLSNHAGLHALITAGHFLRMAVLSPVGGGHFVWQCVRALAQCNPLSLSLYRVMEVSTVALPLKSAIQACPLP